MNNHTSTHRKNNQGEIDKFLKTHNVPKLNHEEIEYLNRPKTGKTLNQ